MEQGVWRASPERRGEGGPDGRSAHSSSGWVPAAKGSHRRIASRTREHRVSSGDSAPLLHRGCCQAARVRAGFRCTRALPEPVPLPRGPQLEALLPPAARPSPLSPLPSLSQEPKDSLPASPPTGAWR